ncbi:group II dsDNA virus coat/capsid protein [Blyttiomyces helicus]|uniref:Group II dsDNA virus coat/capsid protein n=1 Tax=Blyttiomyces helicus TaxID=388810 RepID=A0A4P9WHI5_9FUNG|nr:group II dsDNA virus coat/capsid protein [Blyttiomyces helicus]|eukprot:RKO90550.1 group II dsDNA virus coat/capsid protein [Blyttiomyces helicus]
MFSGGLLQLVAYGSQDVYISGSPQITFFRVVYRLHTNFAMESMEQSFTGNADFGRKVPYLVARNGDLIHKAYLEIDFPALTANSGQTVAWTRNIGHVLISEISVEIGGAIIDKHYSNWLTIYNELTQVAEKEDGFNVLIGNTAALTTPAATIPAAEIYVPLIFRFNRNRGLALPLIALMYHDVKINISLRPSVECYVTSDNNPLATIPVLQNVSLYIDYIFLDVPERRMFSQMNHEYLIEQLQFNGEESYSNASIVQKLNFSHPTKELIWVIQPDANIVGGANSARAAAYFNLLQSYYHHTRYPFTGIYLFSFALEPEKHQPSGSINMSRIEGVNLKMTLSTGTSPIHVYPYAVNYNVLRITSGMGGLAYAN